MQFNRTSGRFKLAQPQKQVIYDKLLILYITNNDRLFVFNRFLDELKHATCKSSVHLLIVNTTTDDEYTSQMTGLGISFTVASVPCPRSDYLPKIRYGIQFAKQYGFAYMLKCDNDIIIPSYTLEYMFANRRTLEKELTLSPSLSTGIPSVEYFIESLFTPEEVDLVRNDFKQCVFHDQENIFDYRPLNRHTIGADKWDPAAYFKSLRQLSESMIQTDKNGRDHTKHSKFYRGNHPIRHGFGNSLINELIVKYRYKLFREKKCSIVAEENTYLCDMCFMISTAKYDRLLNMENLVIDGCDEVPLNRYAWNTGMKHQIVHGGYAIHITYNWRWFLNNQDGGSNIEKPTESIIEFEESFIKKLYEPRSEICIMYMTANDRHYTFKNTVKMLNDSAHIDKIHLLVLTHCNDAEFYNDCLADSRFSYMVKTFDPDNNYMNKIRFTIDFAETNQIPYIVKHDNDIIMCTSVYDYIFEQRSLLDDPAKLAITPTLTSGIPTCDIFIEDYLTDEEKTYMYGLFKAHSFQSMWGGDYRSLNKYTIDSEEWSSAEFYEGVRALTHYYKGIHPVRVNEKALTELNKLVHKYRNVILNPDSYILHEDTTSPYFCNSIYCIRRDIYKQIVNAKELFVDAFDEVPLNKWRDLYSRSIVIVRRGTAIHFMYNCIPNYLQREADAVQTLLNQSE
uniref:Uncharacterized protein n=1 Tax=viral metagenome TaxID=1070528 RepID=A0A6C0J8B0_9ZZZZ